MPLTNFGDLTASIKDWAARPTLSNSICSDFVSMTETVFNLGDEDAGVRPLRVRDMETTATVTVTNGEGDLPANFLAAIKVKPHDGITRNIEYATPEWLDANFPAGQNASYPSYYTIIGGKMVCPVDVDLTYYAKIPTLTGSDDAATNWLLTRAPNAYLYGGLVQYSIWDKHPENVVYYRGLMVNALGAIGYANRFSRAGTMTKRAAVRAW